jgi:hypothetical protein
MGYLRRLLARLGVRHAPSRRGEAMIEERPSEPRCFRHDEFESDPSLVMRRAEQDGSALITDDNGRPRMRIGAPIERPLVVD